MNRDHAQRVLFEQLKRTVPIAAVLAQYGIELKRQGNSLKGCCPIHKGSNSRNSWSTQTRASGTAFRRRVTAAAECSSSSPSSRRWT